MTAKAYRESVWLQIGLFLILCPALGQQPAKVDRTEVPAAGAQKVLLTISQFGRYSIMATGDEGTGLQLVDRMAGPGPVSGKPGEENGRLDLFLDRGEYRILTNGHPGATGKASIVVRPFAEKNDTPPSLLVDFREVESSLADFEQRSYWIEVKQQRRVLLEAAGRSLGDLRLWKDGKWLVETTPSTQVVQARPGRPLLVCQLSAELDPGLYLLTAYGRPPQPWAEDSQEHPLYLRSGIPRLGLALRKRFVSSRFGVDRFLVPGRANYFRLELPAAAPASVGVAPFDPQVPFSEQRVEAQTTKKSVPPVAELWAGTQENDHVVTVKAEPGQGYVLQYFEHLEHPTLQGHGAFWLSTTHLGHPGDSPDATGILVENRPDGQRRLVAGQGLELGLKTAWKRSMNLLTTQQLFLQIKEAGEYLVAGEGIPAQFRIEPFLLSQPANYRAPEFRASGSGWKLGAGWHVLTVQPSRKGVLNLTIRSNTWLDYALSVTGLGGEPSLRATHAAVRFPQVALQQGFSYTLFMTGGTPYGTILRRLPLDLTDPLALAVEPGEEVEVPFRAGEAGMLRAEAEDGGLLEVSVDRGVWQTAAPVEPGSHSVKVRHSKPETICSSLFFQPRRLDPASPLPSLSPEALATIPDFPVLNDAKPQFLDLGRRSQATFVVNAARPGLYQLESTGLLATKGVLRSRTVPAYASESENGTGRNFSLRQYLTQGDYQLSVATLGESAGHLGVQLKRTQSISGGFLTSSVPARISLPATQSVTYYFKITDRAEFRLRAFGAGRTLRCRLEDNEGWPLVPPGVEADITQIFDPGTYRLIILPEMTNARVIAGVEAIRRPRIYQGRGPHSIPLARTVQAVWMEPAAGQERLPDVWEFTLPAASQVSIQLSGEMQAVLRAKTSQSSGSAAPQAAFVPPERGWQGALSAGLYSLEVMSTRVNNRAPYRLAVSPTHLMTGMSREVSAPGQVPISVGDHGTIELWSFGNTDVRGRLYDRDGNLLASNDDRTDDWNFQINRSLTPGEYSLKVDPVGVEKALCTVAMRTPDQDEKGELTLPVRQDVNLGRRILVFPFRPAADASLLTLRASARDSLGLSLEAHFGQGWQLVGARYGLQAELSVPVAGHEPSTQPRYRLKLWSLDQRPTVATMILQSAALTALPESQLADGVALTAIPDSPLAFACVRIDRPGVFQVDSASSDLLWSGDSATACAPAENRLVVAKPGLLIATRTRRAEPSPTAKARRVVLQPGAGTYLHYRHGMTLTCDLADGGPGPVLLRAISTTGQPAVRLQNLSGGGGSRDKGSSRWTVSEHSAIAATLGAGIGVAELWSSEPSDDTLVVRVEPFHFGEPQLEPAPANGDGEVQAQSAKRF
ncbi:MAG: hypothetical protein EHM61_25720, partial [Acidobacteria bacterium]